MTVDRRGFLRGAFAARPPAKKAAPVSPPGPAEVKTGGSRLVPVVGGRYRVWTRKVGRGPVKLLTLHGGPGFGHEYLECLEDFLPPVGVELYYYDQLDCHYSDQPNDESLWTVPRFTDEVEEVRSALGLTEFYLYGHSWGGVLAIEYALKYPNHLRGVVISNMTASGKSYAAYTSALRLQLPPEVAALMERHEAERDYAAPEYEEALFTHLYARHLCRLDPWPEPAGRAMRLDHVNDRVYAHFQGPNEFVVTGTLASWDRWDDLERIAAPTLVMGAHHDTMNPEEIKEMARRIPSARAHVCPKGSHFALYDDQQDYMGALIHFIKDVEARRFRRPSP